jgi:glycosyltransferase involved in cell wall biosynthesis
MVCVGRLVASKRFDRAFDHVARESRAGRHASVVVVGDGPERVRLEKKARALGLEARFVGRATRDDALAWIGAADGLLHASHAEGLSTVVREAEALGVRVVHVA